MNNAENSFSLRSIYSDNMVLQRNVPIKIYGFAEANEVIIGNLANNSAETCANSNGEFIFKVFSTAKRILCLSDGYKSLEECENTFKQIKEVIQNNPIIINN